MFVLTFDKFLCQAFIENMWLPNVYLYSVISKDSQIYNMESAWNLPGFAQVMEKILNFYL